MKYGIICVAMAYERLSDSEALRLACRTIAFNEKLLTTYETMRVDDGRRKRK